MYSSVSLYKIEGLTLYTSKGPSTLTQYSQNFFFVLWLLFSVVPKLPFTGSYCYWYIQRIPCIIGKQKINSIPPSDKNKFWRALVVPESKISYQGYWLIRKNSWPWLLQIFTSRKSVWEKKIQIWLVRLVVFKSKSLSS